MGEGDVAPFILNFDTRLMWAVNFRPGCFAPGTPWTGGRVGTQAGLNLFHHGARAPCGPRPTHYRGFTITLRHTTFRVGFLWTRDQPDADTTHNTHKRKTSMPPAGFETDFSASKRPQTHVLDRAVTGIGWYGRFGKRKSVFATRMRNPDRPSRSLLLYRMR